MKGVGHLNQCDIASLVCLEGCLGYKKMPQVHHDEVYMLHNRLAQSFLAKVGLGDQRKDINLHL